MAHFYAYIHQNASIWLLYHPQHQYDQVHKKTERFKKNTKITPPPWWCAWRYCLFSNYKITNSILNSLLFYPMQTYINSSVYIWSFYWSCVDVWRIYFIKLTSLLACFLYEELWSRIFIHISTFPLFQLVKTSVFLSYLICDL